MQAALPISTLARYAIVVIGLASASSTIGIGWQKVQWLATALTFGLAFGLQEIFANFIAGLIILFERPIRVGDMVTIDNVTGVVSRIRIRATTIGDSDRKEYIVPNKEFITGRTLNWTLSDTINRIVINVGICLRFRHGAGAGFIAQGGPRSSGRPPRSGAESPRSRSSARRASNWCCGVSCPT